MGAEWLYGKDGILVECGKVMGVVGCGMGAVGSEKEIGVVGFWLVMGVVWFWNTIRGTVANITDNLHLYIICAQYTEEPQY